MRPEDLRELNRRQPFEPYRIHITTGQTYDIEHPDQVIVQRSRLVIGTGGEAGISDQIAHMALIHIVQIEELQREARWS